MNGTILFLLVQVAVCALKTLPALLVLAVLTLLAWRLASRQSNPAHAAQSSTQPQHGRSIK